MMNVSSNHKAQNAAAYIDDAMERQTQRRMAFYVAHPELIEQRIGELDEEWDVERLIQAEAPVLTISGIILGTLLGRKWLLMSLAAQGMVFLHAMKGTNPLHGVFRRMGFRTQKEIATERYALRSIRGDFRPVMESTESKDKGDSAFKAVRFSGL